MSDGTKERRRSEDGSRGLSFVGRRRTADVAIALSLTLMTFLGPPAACDAQAKLRKPVSRALATLSIAAPEWKLFAPDVHKLNSYLVADVELADGSHRTWTSPDFRDRSALRRFAEGQLPKYFDALRRDENRAAFRSLAVYAASQVAAGEDVRAVRLERRFYEVPPPPAAGPLPELPPRSEYPGRHVFYERRMR